MQACEAADDRFGPAVSTACRAFDFTLLFEQSILSILPDCVFLLLGCVSLISLFNRKQVVVRSAWHYWTSLLAFTALIGLSLGLLVIRSLSDTSYTRCSIAAAALTVASFLLCIPLYRLQFFRSARPSLLLDAYLFLTSLLTAVQVRTLWLKQGSSVDAGLSSAILAGRIVVLVSQTWSKRPLLVPSSEPRHPESTSNLFAICTLWWINPIIHSGFRNRLAVPSVHGSMQAELLLSSATKTWPRKGDPTKSPPSLFLCMLQTHWVTFCAGLFPRACYLALTIAQPFLVRVTLDWFQGPEAKSDSIGYGLIGAFGLVYIGIAVGESLSYHYANQLIVKVRGSLVALIHDKTLRLLPWQVQETSPITLMGSDTDRISNGLRFLHDAWASMIQIGVALYLLEREVHWGALASSIVTIVAIGSTLLLATGFGKAQKIWLEAVEKRVDSTSAVLNGIRSVKAGGLSDTVSQSLQSLKLTELHRSGRYRKLLVLIVGLGFTNQTLVPPFALGTYALVLRSRGQLITSSDAFTALSVLNILTAPLDTLFQALPALISAVACTQRIALFLLQDDLESPTAESCDQEICSSGHTEKSEEKKANRSLTADSIRWGLDGKSVLADVDIDLVQGGLNCIIGPVGSGKTTLLMTLLGETVGGKLSPVVRSMTKSLCGQSSWIMDESIEHNIVGPRYMDHVWFSTVVHACALDIDAKTWPGSYNMRAGHNGDRLSGGQRQRVALARAIYARSDMLLLDDSFSGLDAVTEKRVTASLFGSGGILRSTTVVFALHSARALHLADLLICLDQSGRVSGQGPLVELQDRLDFAKITSGNVPDTKSQIVLDKAESETTQQAKVEDHMPSFDTDLQNARQTPDRATYAYYVRAMGYVNTTIYVFSTAIFVVLMVYPSIWVQEWTAANMRSPSTSNQGFYIGIYAMLGILASLMVFYGSWQLFFVMTKRSSANLHRILLKTTMGAPLWFFSQVTGGTILNRFSQDMTLIDMDLPVSFINTWLSLLLCIAQLVILAVTTRYFAAVLPIYLLSCTGIALVYNRTGRQLRILEIENKAPLYGHFVELLTGLSHIRAYGWQEWSGHKVMRRIDGSQQTIYALYSVQQWLTLVLNLLVASVAVLIVGFSLVLRNTISPGFVGVALVNTISFGTNLKSLITSWTILEQAMGAITRVRSYEKSTPVEETNHSRAHDPPPNWPHAGEIMWNQFSAAYDAKSPLILHAIDFKIPAGHKVAICGRTGSGKSSLAMSLLRMVEPRTGSVTVDGMPLEDCNRHELRRHFNALAQDAVLLGGSLRYNMDPPGEASDALLLNVLEKVELLHLVTSSADGLDTEVAALKLSQGQRQLLCLARALLKQSKIVILDEATSAVDTHTDSRIQPLLMEYFRDSTMIIVTHRLHHIMSFDCVIIMDDGVLVESGSPSDLAEREGSAFRRMLAVDDEEAERELSSCGSQVELEEKEA